MMILVAYVYIIIQGKDAIELNDMVTSLQGIC